jgi:uncharacterized protein
LVPRTAATALRELFAGYPAVLVTGPRQSGKTTLCRTTFPELAYANLESPDTRRFALEDPHGFLAQFPDGAILDEVQRVPELPSYLQVTIDERRSNSLFVLTGSQQFAVREQFSQSLAGRCAILRLLPFSLEELHSMPGGRVPRSVDELMVKGFYPRIYDQDLNPTQALGDYIELYLERDLRRLSAVQDLGLFQRFLRLCAGRCGQLLNLNSLASDAGIAHSTATAWMSLLETSYVVFRLPPHFENIGKRLVKSPKLYFFDTGLAAYLLDIFEPSHVTRHPLRGSLFENLVVAEVFKFHWHRNKPLSAAFYRDGSGNEVDLLIRRGHLFSCVEVKAGSTVSPDYFRGLDRFAGVFGERVSSRAIVYTGEASGPQSGTAIVPYGGLPEYLSSLG